MAADTSQADPAAAPLSGGTLSAETLCLQLGWSMQRLYRARPVPEPPRDPLPDRLPGLSGLNRRERAEIDYDRALTCLTAIAGALSWPADQTPDLGPIGYRLNAFRAVSRADAAAGTPSGAAEPAVAAELGGADASPAGDLTEPYRQAVLDGHLALIVATTGARATLGKAYSLGRALADTCRPGQSLTDLRRGFDPYRLAQLRHDLNDLASVLPAHAAKAVGQSLTWWRDAVYMADDSPDGLDRRRRLGNVRTDAPGLRRPPGIANPKISTAAPSGDMDALRRALPRQGELWRVVLTGEQRPLDLLTPGAYLDAALRAVSAGLLPGRAHPDGRAEDHVRPAVPGDRHPRRRARVHPLLARQQRRQARGRADHRRRLSRVAGQGRGAAPEVRGLRGRAAAVPGRAGLRERRGHLGPAGRQPRLLRLVPPPRHPRHARPRRATGLRLRTPEHPVAVPSPIDPGPSAARLGHVGPAGDVSPVGPGPSAVRGRNTVPAGLVCAAGRCRTGRSRHIRWAGRRPRGHLTAASSPSSRVVVALTLTVAAPSGRSAAASDMVAPAMLL